MAPRLNRWPKRALWALLFLSAQSLLSIRGPHDVGQLLPLLLAINPVFFGIVGYAFLDWDITGILFVSVIAAIPTTLLDVFMPFSILSTPGSIRSQLLQWWIRALDWGWFGLLLQISILTAVQVFFVLLGWIFCKTLWIKLQRPSIATRNVP